MVIVGVMLLVGFDLGEYIAGALVICIWRIIVMGEDHSPGGVITSDSTMGIFGLLMPTVFTPEGWGNLGTADLYPHGNR
jgi:hypothetical protein